MNKSKSRLMLLMIVLTVSLSLPSAPASLSSLVVSDLQELAMIPEARGDLEDLNDPPKYQIRVEVNLDERSPSFIGEEKISFTNNEGVGLEKLYLRLYPNGHKTYGNGRLEITQILVAGQEVQLILSTADTVVEVPLPQLLEPQEQITLDVAFTGIVSSDSAIGSSFHYGVYSQNQGVVTLANWYPMLAVYDDEGWNLDPVYGWGDAVYSDVSLYEVRITAPAEALVVATGSRVPGLSSSEGNTATDYYVSGPTRDFFVALSRDFQLASREVGDTIVNSYFLPGNTAGGQAALEVGASAVEVFDELFGLYPYVEFDVLVPPLPFSGGVEYPGLILLSDRLDQTDITFQWVVAHEVAHQWWYGVVGNDVLDEPWLDEALVTYCSAVYIEETLGDSAFQAVLDDWRRRYERARAKGVNAPIASPVTAFTGNSDYTPIVYYGGALFYHALRQRIGDEAFFQSLQKYYQEFKYRVATTEELLALFEEVSGQQLDDLYQGWLFAGAPAALCGLGP